MQINRLFEIVYLLLNKKTTTANELAAHFEVSRRTILRDIDALSQAGIPICTAPGKGGGISILDNFVLNKATISDEEQNQILFALQSLGTAEHMEVTDILAKLQVLFDKLDTNWIEIDLSRWGNINSDNEKFELLKKAIIHKLALSFQYASSYGQTTSRTVYPLKLVFKAKSWYLQAYCPEKKDYRTFKINRIITPNITEESFQGTHFLPPPIDTSKPASGSLVHLVLKFTRHAAYRIFDEFDSANIVQNPDGTFLVTIDMPEDYWLYSFLLSFGRTVLVLEPENVKENLLREVEKIRILNSGS